MTRRLEISFAIDDGEPRTIALTGRDAWALSQLIRAGHRGCPTRSRNGRRRKAGGRRRDG